MLRKWLKISVFILFVFIEGICFSQEISDTLDEFVKTEVITPFQTFSSHKILDSSGALGNLSDLLENSSSVYLKNYGKGQLATLSIRGSGASQTQLFWNGFKINSPTLGQTDLSLIPLFFIAQATLNYSGASSSDGSGGIGGSLQLSSRLGWKKGMQIEIGKEFASFQNATSTFRVSYGEKNITNELKVLYHKGKNDFRFLDLSKKNFPLVSQVNNEVNQFGVQYGVGYQLNSKNLIQSTLFYFDSKRQLPPIIGGVTNRENQKNQNFKGFVSWKSFQDKFNSDFKLSYFEEDLDYTDSISRIFSEVKVKTYQTQWRVNFIVLQSMKIESSIQGSYSDVFSTGFSNSKNRTEFGLFLKASQKIKSFCYELFYRKELVDSSLSPSVYGIGLKYNLLKESLTVYVNFSKNYRVPTLNDLYWEEGGNTQLIPEEGKTAEAGVNSKLKFIEFNLTGFYNQTSNWIQWQPTDFGYWTPKNVKNVENKGFEFSMKSTFKIKQVAIGVGAFYTFTDSKIRHFEGSDEIEGKLTSYLPKHKASFQWKGNYKNGYISYSQIFNSRVFIDASNSSYLPFYYPANLEVGYLVKFSKLKFEVGGRIVNLYNEPYQVVANRPIPGRNYSIFTKIMFQ